MKTGKVDVNAYFNIVILNIKHMGGALSNERMYNLVLLLKTNDCPVSHIIWKGLTISDFLNIETTEAAKIFIRKMKQEKPNNFIAIAQYITKLVPAVSMLILDPNQKDKTSDVSALLNYICYIFSVSCDKAINSVWFHPLISHSDIVEMLKSFLNIFGIHDSAENFYHSSNMYLRSISFKCVLFFVFSSVYSDKTNHSIHDYQDFFLEGVDPTIFLELIIPYLLYERST
ncbi:hypothetical protein TRFO_41267 [Tritrichomonas foetus]|uniref:Uncharacterized protein n=1 Tax=Tritrichomonas foetus TaxID=1144522 RepID=A0A1J4L5E5_9EUKA|nr:hypothetical protein TRFO_41267 [Tritrichomonas foetus]|eukprot:OHT17157.1 hypothetical protein TRFO_41267 [Tritrichomonas foetus]